MADGLAAWQETPSKTDARIRASSTLALAKRRSIYLGIGEQANTKVDAFLWDTYLLPAQACRSPWWLLAAVISRKPTVMHDLFAPMLEVGQCYTTVKREAAPSWRETCRGGERKKRSFALSSDPPLATRPRISFVWGGYGA